MKIIGITGPSGAGKTTVLREFEEQGAFAVDADAVYHRLLESDDAMLAAIKARFPMAIVRGEHLDRKALGRQVYDDPAALRDLEKITHPAVIRETNCLLEQAKNSGYDCAVIDAVALFQSGMDSICDTTIGVLASFDDRLARIMARDGITEEYALQRMKSQPDDEYYISRCDRIIYN